MRIVAIVMVYNEEIFIENMLRNYLEQGVEVYLLNNDSTDRTIEIATKYLTENLIKIERFPKKKYFDLREVLRKKEEIAETLGADWYLHADADEIRLPPKGQKTLKTAIEEVDQKGFNAVNFMEYTFVPTTENPIHLPESYMDTMKWYYPFARNYPHRVNCWKYIQKTPTLFEHILELKRHGRWLVPSARLGGGGHRIEFENRKIFPQDFIMRHYIAISREHAIQKYVPRLHKPENTVSLHGWRASAKSEDFRLPFQSEMKLYTNDENLDPSKPLREHLIIKKNA
ncbi:glycosyltransferase family 2 protein [Allochromatium palmeri]|uniref:Glycosyltransferase n=1 Tax=Allochromatium palmeri TaxID=231048 RepID=A0A6N8EF82_9GAMM|nr:glycosyltransferase family 2 protein [Allochromatium palmeri]MTW21197.1 glycosyltransferase [Allochromatium palmeri]